MITFIPNRAASAHYGTCEKCGEPLSPVWFTEKERDRHGIWTGRTRHAVDYLLCESCGEQECVDDSFDGPWQ